MPYITFKNEGALYHAEKGSTWSNHKYIRIENGRYIYPEDLKGNQKSYQTSTKNNKGVSIKKSSTISDPYKINTQYQIDYIEDTKRDFESSISFNREYINEHKAAAEKIFEKNKKATISDVAKVLHGLESRTELLAELAAIYIADIIKDTKLSDATKTACSKYVIQKILSELATVSSAYRNIVNKTKDGDVDRGEKISETYKEIKKLYEKTSNATNFSKEDFESFVIDINPNWLS